MNIIDLIKEQLSGELLGKLASALGQNPATTTKAAQAKNLGPLKELVAKVLALPGVADKLKPILDGLITKLTDIK